MLKYESVSELVAEAEKRNIKISELVLEYSLLPVG